MRNIVGLYKRSWAMVGAAATEEGPSDPAAKKPTMKAMQRQEDATAIAKATGLWI